LVATRGSLWYHARQGAFATGTQLKTSSSPAKERCTSIEEQNNSGAGLVCITRGDAKTQVREVKGNGLQ